MSENVTTMDDGQARLPSDASRTFLRTCDLAKLLGVSERDVDSLDSRGLLPLPVRLGNGKRACKRWFRPDLIRWAEASCPPRHEWEAIKQCKGSEN